MRFVLAILVLLSVAQLSSAQSSGACALCEFIVDKLEGWISQNSTEAEIVNAVENVCNILPSTVRSSCVSLIETYGDEVIQMFIQKEDPETMCKQLSLCSSTKKAVKKVAKPQGASCSLCEFIVDKLEGWIGSNATEAQIVNAVENICSILPSSLSSQCDTLIEQYGPALIQMFLQKEPPQVMCTQLNLCSSSTFRLDQNLDNVPVLDDELIAHVNSVAHWTAGRNPRFEGVTVAEAKKLLGAKVAPAPGTKISKLRRPGALPVSFDSRKQWPLCVHPVRNQAQCGSCWAFGATESFSDRLCIATKNKTNVILSPQWVVSCDQTDYGCQGGYLQNAWEFMAGTGVVTNNCDPYTSQDGNVAPCPSSCVDGSNFNLKYKVNANTIQTLTDAPSMQQAIMSNGPVEAAFSVYQDFFSYTSGVYVHTSGQLMGGHAIKIVGWGVDASTKQDYWIVYNSWGTSWGMDGLFWILRGADECGIEDNCVIGMPAN